MKTAQRLAVCGVLCALSTAILLMTFFPYMTYALAALAGIVLIPAALEFGTRYGVTAYVVTAFLAFFVAPDPEAKLLFILFFGYYPLVRLRVQLWETVWLAWMIKLLLFNAAAIGSFFASLYVLGIPKEEFMINGFYWPPLLLLAGNAVFLVYDLALERVSALYRVRIHPLFKRYFK